MGMRCQFQGNRPLQLFFPISCSTILHVVYSERQLFEVNKISQGRDVNASVCTFGTFYIEKYLQFDFVHMDTAMARNENIFRAHDHRLYTKISQALIRFMDKMPNNTKLR